MTTYQDVVDYLNSHYYGDYELNNNEPEGCAHTIEDGAGDEINIYEKCYNSSLTMYSELSRLLADLLDTPVDKRINSEIKHTVKPATAESINTANLLIRLTSIDQVIQSINTFLVNARCNSNPIMTIATDIGEDNLNKVLKLYDDYNIVITNQSYNSNVFNLLIESK